MSRLASIVSFLGHEVCSVVVFVFRRVIRRAAPQICCPAGTVLGSLEVGGAVVAYRGVYYASAPRFKSPTAFVPARGQPLNPTQRLHINAQPWTPVMVPAPMLLSLAAMVLRLPFRRGVHGSHPDGQQLNIFAPRDHMKRSRPLPVLVVIHGGAYFLGSADMQAQDGARAAAALDAVVVMINYRLGVMGFASHDKIPANLGYQDMLAALRWVKSNIRSFNGDASNITLNGESAGAHACMLLLANAENAAVEGGLFHRVFVQSAPSARNVSQAVCRAATEEVARAVGWSSGSCAEFLASSRKADGIVLAASKVTGHKMALLHGMPFAPLVDGTIIRHSVYDGLAINGPAIAGVPLLTMHTRNEYTLFRELHLSKFGHDDAAALKHAVTSVAANYSHSEEFVQAMISTYSNKHSTYIQSFGKKLPSATAFLSDCFLSVPSQRGAVLHRQCGGESHIIRFDVKGNPMLGLQAGHFVDVPYVFQNTHACRLICGPVVNTQAQEELLTIVKGFVHGRALPWPSIDISGTTVRRNVLVLKNDVKDPPGEGRPELATLEADPFPEFYHVFAMAH
jgi:carboxylesterase type B